MEMTKKRLIPIAVAVLALIAAAGSYYYFSRPNAAVPSAPSPEESRAVRDVVTEFGKRLQLVSVAADPDLAADEIRKNYTPYVATALILRWTDNPAAAPGRLTSSPWPDHIEITSAVKEGEEFYRVTGKVIEVTSADRGHAAATYPVTLEVGWDRDRAEWVITAFDKGDYE